MVSLLLEVLVGGCQGGMPQDEVSNFMKLICTLQHTLQVVLIPASRKPLRFHMAWSKASTNTGTGYFALLTAGVVGTMTKLQKAHVAASC